MRSAYLVEAMEQEDGHLAIGDELRRCGHARMAGVSRGSRRTRPSWTAAAVTPARLTRTLTHIRPAGCRSTRARAVRVRASGKHASASVVARHRRAPAASAARDGGAARRSAASARRGCLCGLPRCGHAATVRAHLTLAEHVPPW